MKHYMLFTFVAIAFTACSGKPSSTNVLDVINARLADPTYIQCVDFDESIVDLRRDIAGKPWDRTPWYLMLQRDGYTALRSAKADDNYENGFDSGFQTNPSGYKTWIFTTKGQKQFPQSKDNKNYRTICIGSPHAASIVSDASMNNGVDTAAHSVTINQDFSFQPWVTDTDKAEIIAFYKTHPGWVVAGGFSLRPTQKTVIVDEPTNAPPHVTGW